MSHPLDTTSGNKRNPKVAPIMHQKKTGNPRLTRRKELNLTAFIEPGSLDGKPPVNLKNPYDTGLQRRTGEKR
jgi:hypothetical protein